MAVQRLKPSTQLALGPWIDHGFYYDFHHLDGNPFTEDDLKRIKAEMDRIIKANLPMVVPSAVGNAANSLLSGRCVRKSVARKPTGG
jgi:threonyl-tRNA synthetase